MTDEDRIRVEVIGAQQYAQDLAREASEAGALSGQKEAFASALEQVEKIRDFIGDPDHILGSAKTKHGEIAEQVQVGITNARRILEGMAANSTFEGVGRNAPTDYLVDGVEVQSKFINGLNRNLDHVLDHLEQHEGFAKDGAYYHIPKEHFAKIAQAIRGEGVDGLAKRTIEALQAKVDKIRELTGREFGDVVRPGTSKYAEVQQGKIVSTLDGHEENLRGRNQELRDAIKTDHEVTWQDGGAAVGKGAAVGAALRFSVALYKKRKKRGSFAEITTDDWKDLGLEGAKGGLQGGVAAGALFAITHSTDLAAPFAGSVVSAAMGMKTLVQRHRVGEIDDTDLVELGQVVCAEAAIVALATAAGQAIIPVPVLGAVVGALAGRVATGTAKWAIENSDVKLARMLEESFAQQLAELNEEHGKLVEEMLAHFDRLGQLTDAAFDLERNVSLRFAASIELAEAHGVKDALILRTTNDLDAFMGEGGER